MTISKVSFWRRLWQAWLRLGHWIGNVMSWVWMPLFYFVFVMPIALGIKLFADPLHLRMGQRKSYWLSKKLPKLNLEWAKNQGSTVSGESKK